ncbi:unnamed protein product, partial [Sphacelaria rigidula]
QDRPAAATADPIRATTSRRGRAWCRLRRLYRCRNEDDIAALCYPRAQPWTARAGRLYGSAYQDENIPTNSIRRVVNGSHVAGPTHQAAHGSDDARGEPGANGSGFTGPTLNGFGTVRDSYVVQGQGSAVRVHPMDVETRNVDRGWQNADVTNYMDLWRTRRRDFMVERDSTANFARLVEAVVVRLEAAPSGEECDE